MCSDVAISVKNLTKTYRIFGHPGDRIKQAFTFGRMRFHREFTALKDVCFDIKKGETVGIIGRNGSGKSTLLQLVCGILKPTSGTVVVRGRIAALLELGAGFNSEFTGRENVYFQGAVMGIPKEEMARRFDGIAAFADIGTFIDQPVRMYSSGMYLRLAFATAVNVDAEILVVDEALAVGDAIFAQKCMHFLQKFRSEGTLIIVSHDLATVTALCDRVLWIEEGGMRAIGDARIVCENYIATSLGMLASPSNEGIEIGADVADQRQELLIRSNLRNDLEVFHFDESAAASGTGLAAIINAKMQNSDGVQYSYVIGGELITLAIRARAQSALLSPIVGFIVKNRLGQSLIGDNTYLSYASKPVSVSEGGVLEARFHFRMPRLPTGEYSICITVAEGVPGMHQTHHRINEAIRFHSQSSSVSQVLVGLPMLSVNLELVQDYEQTD